MIKGIEHFGICAKDTEALKDWYVKLFDFKIVYENNKTPKTYFLAADDGSMLEIYPANETSNCLDNKVQGLRHIALIPQNFEEMCKSLKDNNVEIIQEAAVSSKGIKTIFFKDLEGNIIHLIDRPQPLI